MISSINNQCIGGNVHQENEILAKKILTQT